MNNKRNNFFILIKSLLLATAGIFTFALIYFFSAWALAFIPVNSGYTNHTDGISVYIASNGVHTDILVPTVTDEINWEEYINPEDFKKTQERFNYISFGWGDKGFFLETPTWAELKASVALNAAFLPSSTAMHVAYLNNPPVESDHKIKINISKGQYRKLVLYIRNSFQTDGSGKFIRIPCCGYKGINDNFYEAKGYYHLFYTCNSWTNEALKTIGVKTAVWAPFDKAILYQLKRIRKNTETF